MAEDLDCPEQAELFSNVVDMGITGTPNADEELAYLTCMQTVKHFDDGQRYAFQ